MTFHRLAMHKTASLEVFAGFAPRGPAGMIVFRYASRGSYQNALFNTACGGGWRHRGFVAIASCGRRLLMNRDGFKPWPQGVLARFQLKKSCHPIE